MRLIDYAQVGFILRIQEQSEKKIWACVCVASRTFYTKIIMLVTLGDGFVDLFISSFCFSAKSFEIQWEDLIDNIKIPQIT